MLPKIHRFLLSRCLSVAFTASCSVALGQLEFEKPPIDYETAPLTDRVQSLVTRIESGDSTLERDAEHGYLKAVLKELDVPLSSQVLVFSKTSSQIHKIDPQRPRAVYFNDDVYIGWVQYGKVVEISSADPQLGAVFFTIDQKQPRAEVVRDQGQCLTCHASSRTQGVPGHLMRSLYASKSGQPEFGAGTFSTDDRSPIAERWGGWYVTGTHGKQRHMGNVLVTDLENAENLDTEAGANITSLDELVDMSPYLTPHSDIVALMVLGHQARVHNLITRANFETRSALHYDQIMNRALERPSDYRSESTDRRIADVAEKLVKGLLFAGEAPLTDRVEGTSNFAAEFAALGPFDKKGRSLRAFDLEARLFKYPCSFLIYTDSFDGLPDEVKSVVYRRMHDVLTGKDPGPIETSTNEDFAHLSADDRHAILEILRETKEGLPSYWASE